VCEGDGPALSLQSDYCTFAESGYDKDTDACGEGSTHLRDLTRVVSDMFDAFRGTYYYVNSEGKHMVNVELGANGGDALWYNRTASLERDEDHAGVAQCKENPFCDAFTVTMDTTGLEAVEQDTLEFYSSIGCQSPCFVLNDARETSTRYMCSMEWPEFIEDFFGSE